MRLWGESLEACQSTRGSGSTSTPDSSKGAVSAPAKTSSHPFSTSAADLQAILALHGIDDFGGLDGNHQSTITLRLPTDATGPWPSERLARLTGAIDLPVDPWLAEFSVPVVTLPNHQALGILLALEEHRQSNVNHHEQPIEHGQTLHFWINVAQFIVDLLADQRFTPALQHGAGAALIAAWQPWFHDEDGRARAGAMLA